MPNIKELIAEKAKSLDGNGDNIVEFSNTTNFDIIDSGKFRWTINRLPPFISKEIPYIELNEYRQNVSQFLNSLLYRAGTSVESFKNSIKITDIQTQGIFGVLVNSKNEDSLIKEIGGIETTTGDSVFGNLYIGNSTNRYYRFPFLSEEIYSLANEWSDASQEENIIVDMLGTTAKDLMSSFMAPSKVFSTSSFTETVKSYKPCMEGNKVKLKFTLYNTMEKSEVMRHYDFVVHFMKVNKHIRTNRTNLLPPVYYTMNIPGIRYSPACYVSGLNIRNEGKTRIIENKIIPDAYNIDIELTDLVSDCANLIGNISNMKKVNVIQNREDFIKSGKFSVFPDAPNPANESSLEKIGRQGFQFPGGF